MTVLVGFFFTEWDTLAIISKNEIFWEILPAILQKPFPPSFLGKYRTHNAYPESSNNFTRIDFGWNHIHKVYPQSLNNFTSNVWRIRIWLKSFLHTEEEDIKKKKITKTLICKLSATRPLSSKKLDDTVQVTWYRSHVRVRVLVFK